MTPRDLSRLLYYSVVLTGVGALVAGCAGGTYYFVSFALPALWSVGNVYFLARCVYASTGATKSALAPTSWPKLFMLGGGAAAVLLAGAVQPWLFVLGYQLPLWLFVGEAARRMVCEHATTKIPAGDLCTDC